MTEKGRLLLELELPDATYGGTSGYAPAPTPTAIPGSIQPNRAELDKFLRENYDLKRTFEAGNFGDVYLAVLKSDLRMPVVVKVPKARLTVEEQEEFRAEADVLKGLHHPRIVRFRDFFNSSKTGNCAVIEMEYAAGGCLKNRIVRRSLPAPCMGPKDTARIIYDVLQALEYIHQLNIVHLDIK